MRCLTLAEAMRGLGWPVVFLSRPHSGHLLQIVQRQGFACYSLPLHSVAELHGYQQWLGCTEQQDADDCLSALTDPVDMLVVDHYGLGQTFCRQLRTKSAHVMVIDDLANRQHDCDLLLDQNLFPDLHQRYQGLVNPGCQLLLGPNFALLRNEFYEQHSKTKSEDIRLLVFFGGADADNLTAMAIEAIAQLKDLPLTADIVIGASNPNREQIIRLCSANAAVRLHIQTPSMAQLMTDADLMLGAGGSTHWERCKLGLPALVVTLAENQVATSAYLHQLGACVWLGDVKEMTCALLAKQLRHYLAAPASLQQMRQVATTIIGTDAGTPNVLNAIRQRLNA